MNIKTTIPAQRGPHPSKGGDGGGTLSSGGWEVQVAQSWLSPLLEWLLQTILEPTRRGAPRFWSKQAPWGWNPGSLTYLLCYLGPL